MKRIYLIAVAAVSSLFILSACNKNWLNPDVQGQASSSDSTFNNPANAFKFVTGCYTQLLNWDVHSFGWIGLSSITSDDADKGSSPGDLGSDKNLMDDLTYTATASSVSSVWGGYFRGVSYCAQALYYIPRFTLASGVAAQYEGEVKFLRAYYYFTLVRAFGDIPLVDVVANPFTEDGRAKLGTRVSRDSIYALIESDLKYAISVLPAKEQLGASQAGRANKGAAVGLLAKVSLYEKKWQQALDLTNQLISGSVGSYALAPDYTTIWREVGENSVESVFEVQSKSTTPYAAVQQYSQVQGIRGGNFNISVYTGWGFNTPTLDLDNAYEAGDVRKKSTIIHRDDTLFDGAIMKGIENDRYNYKAYPSNTQETYGGDPSYTNKNVRIIRMGEIYLINAEAANELGTGTAVASLNAVRNRAGLGNTTASTQADIRNAIWKERRVELAMENDRFFDLVRQGRAGTVLRAHGKNFVDGKNELFPIPQQEIDASNNALKQNPGY